jgi:hypothetical protein
MDKIVVFACTFLPLQSLPGNCTTTLGVFKSEVIVIF